MTKRVRAVAAKAAAFFCAVCLMVSLVGAANPAAQAAPGTPSRFIAIVYDDSGSMRYQGGRDKLKNYIYANYSLQNLVALMDDSDSAKVYLISKDGKDPITVTKQKDLSDEFKSVTAAKSADTFAGTVNAAMKDGAAYLRGNADGRFLFILITDGETMYDDRDKEISGSLKPLFNGYIRQNGLDQQSGRSSALLLSIGPAKPLGPVSDMDAALTQAGIYTQPFIADIVGKSQSAAGDNIRSAMTDLAESMASTNMMTVEPGKPFAVRYPLESMVVMEQAQQGSAIQSISGGGEELVRTPLYQTNALGGENLSSTFSSVTAPKGSVKPGTYTLQATGSVQIAVFSKVGFTPDIVLADKAGRTVAEYRDNQWNVPDISLHTGDKLAATVKFTARDGTNVDIGPHVSLGFGKTGPFSCTATGQGTFELTGVSKGLGYLDVGLADPEYFQLTVPALPVNVVSEDAILTPAPQNTAPGATKAAPAQAGEAPPAFDADGLLDMPGTEYAVLYTSSKEYGKAAGFTLAGVRSDALRAEFSPAPPRGLRIVFNGVTFDADHPSGTVNVAQANTVDILADADFTASGKQRLDMRFETGETVPIYIVPKARALRVEASPAKLEFGVMDGEAAAPSCSWKVMIQENGQWREAAPQDGVSVRAVAPIGIVARCDETGHTLKACSGWPQALSPVGQCSVEIIASTGKPGETATAAISVLVRDDVRRWLPFVLEALAVVLLAGYAVLIVRKRRIPLEYEAFAAGQADMAGAERVSFARNLPKRNFWPFGREVCTVGVLELYPHPKKKDLIVLSSVAVQYSLKIDGKSPQYHGDRDEAGDFILGAENVVGVRIDGAFKYYKFINPALKSKKG